MSESREQRDFQSTVLNAIMQCTAVIDFDKVREQITSGNISATKHSAANLWIYNYTARTQYEKSWTPETIACRGLIADADDRIVARPFAKFFTLDQMGGYLPDESFEVTEKLDGSLGILYWINNEPSIATRGSFESEQAKIATKVFRDRYASLDWDPNKTYLFEIVYPENRIVVDYGKSNDIFLLACIETETRIEQPLPDWDIPKVQKHGSLSGSREDFEKLLAIQEDNREGFVVRFESGFRVKIKFEQYTRLHGLFTKFGVRQLWQELCKTGSLDKLIEMVPDEYYDWVRDKESELRTEFKEIEDVAKSEMKSFETRKEAAAYFQTCQHPNIMFAMLDGKDYSRQIWQMLDPEHDYFRLN